MVDVPGELVDVWHLSIAPNDQAKVRIDLGVFGFHLEYQYEAGQVSFWDWVPGMEVMNEVNLNLFDLSATASIYTGFLGNWEDGESVDARLEVVGKGMLGGEGITATVTGDLQVSGMEENNIPMYKLELSGKSVGDGLELSGTITVPG